MTSLYELAGSYCALLDLADSADPADQQSFHDTIDGLEGDIKAKIVSCAAVVRSIDSQADAVKAEEERLAARRKALIGSRDRLKKYMQDAMEKVGLSKVSDPIFSVSIQANAPSVQLDVPPDQLPLRYRRVTVEANKSAIAEDLKAGVDLGFARLEKSRSLRIR